jgi:hypothetical protein
VKRAGFGKLEGFGVVNQLFRRPQMAFDLKQCEADGWKCEVVLAQNRNVPEVAEYCGQHRDELYLMIQLENGVPMPILKSCIRNITKPKVKRWLYGHAPYSEALDKAVDVRIPLIEDSTGIRVDHSDAVIEALEELKGWPPSTPHYANIDLMIAKIKKDRGE